MPHDIVTIMAERADSIRAVPESGPPWVTGRSSLIDSMWGEPVAASHRQTVMHPRPLRAVIVTAVVAPLLTSCLGGTTAADGKHASGISGSCAAVVRFDGRTYVGHGDLRRSPETTGRAWGATVPSCEDGNGAAPAARVRVRELRGISIGQALLVDGQLFLAKGEPIPEVARVWFAPPRCDTDSPPATGQWRGVPGGPQPRLDGGLHPPCRFEPPDVDR